VAEPIFGDIHRIGGGSVANLRLKPKEAALEVPGISVLKADSPGIAARSIRAAFPKARGLHELSNIVGTTSEEMIRAADFEIIPVPTIAFPNHHRIVHGNGVVGFTDENLARLSLAFFDSEGH
jgi:hypothetical protein